MEKLVCADKMMAATHQLFGERPVLFKDKINFKLPGGDGFKPHSPSLDKVYTLLELVKPLSSDPKNGPGRVRLHLKNLGDVPATDTFSVEIRSPSENTSGPAPVAQGEPAASVVGKNQFSYTLKPGEQTGIEFELSLVKGTTAKEIRVHIPRSSRSVGRRTAGLNILVDKNPAPTQVKWLPEHSKDRPPEWNPFPDHH